MNIAKKSLIRTAIKARFKKNLGFKEIITATLDADNLKDTLFIKGTGYLPGEVVPCLIEPSKPFKLSDYQDSMDTFLTEITDEIEALEVHAALLVFNYEKNVLSMTVKYLNYEKEKCKETIEVKF